MNANLNPEPTPREWNVLLFAGLKDAVGRDSITVHVDAASPRLADLLEACAQQFPVIARWLPHVRVAVDCEYSAADVALHGGEEIALIPPVAGG